MSERNKKEKLTEHEKYGRIFRLIEEYGGGIDKWEKKNKKILLQLRQTG